MLAARFSPGKEAFHFGVFIGSTEEIPGGGFPYAKI